MNLSEMKRKKMSELVHMGTELNIEGVTNMRRQDLIFALLQSTGAKGEVFGDGVLETLPDGFGFLRSPDYNYLPCPDDIYISPSQIRRLRAAHRRHGGDGPDPPAQGERAVLRPAARWRRINSCQDPTSCVHQTAVFEDLTPLLSQQVAAPCSRHEAAEN